MTAVAPSWIRSRSSSLAIGLLIACGLLATFSIGSWSPVSAEDNALAEKPFAEHRLVLQLSDNDPKKQRLVISIAYNLLKFYGPDRIAIEVVTFGPGIDLLQADNVNRQLVDSLVAQGVRFDVCMNTVETLERETGRRPQFNPNAVAVEAGVAQILALTENGYTLVRP
jgi:intracellular sulfur oxidation DsrE/DsrF family protein